MRIFAAGVALLWPSATPPRAPVLKALAEPSPPPPLPFTEDLNLIYDGKCGVCQWEKDNLLSLGAEGTITFTDLEAPEGYDAASPRNNGVSYEAGMARITAVTRDGEVITGMRVFSECYQAVGVPKWIFAPLDWPVIGEVIERAYESFAAVRTDVTRGRSLTALVADFNGRSGRFDWGGFERHFIGGLKRPLLVAVGGHGYMACGYVDVATADKLGEACAIVTGVDTCDDFLDAEVQRASEAAVARGVCVGMRGQEALELLR